MRRLAIIGAAVIALTGLSTPAWADPSPTASPTAAQATPDTIIMCAYGDNFYHFRTNAPGGWKQYLLAGNPQVLTDDLGGTSNDLFCQTDPIGGFSEWVKKGTSACLTLDATISYKIDLKTCIAGKASQLWGLVDNHGGENWNGIESDYMNAGFRYWADGYYNGSGYAQGLQGWAPSTGSMWDWNLDGPYR